MYIGKIGLPDRADDLGNGWVVDGDGLGRSGRGDGGSDLEERPGLNLLDSWPTVAFCTLS